MIEFTLPAAITFVAFGLFALVMDFMDRRRSKDQPKEPDYHPTNEG